MTAAKRGISLFLGRISIYLAPTASLVTLILGYEHLVDNVQTDARFGMSLLTGFAVFYLVVAITQEYRFSRKARYAEAMPYVYQAVHLCMDGAAIEGPCTTEREICSQGEKICEQLSRAFTLITATHCSVCIKVLDANPSAPESPNASDRISVSTLCRDSVSVRKRQSVHESVVHWMDMNTDFMEMFQTMNSPNGGTYFANNLPGTQDYVNSSFDVYEKPRNLRIPVIRDIYRNLNWPLPYKSTVGAAIYPRTPSQNAVLVGYLCVDSSSRRVFSKRYDTDTIREMSACLYPMMLKWSEFVDQSGEDENDS